MDDFDHGSLATMAMTMPGFDTMSSSLLTPMGTPEHALSFDLDAFAGADLRPHRHLDLKHHLSHDGYQDSLSDVGSGQDTLNGGMETFALSDSLAIDRDSRLLSFSPPIHNYALLDYTYRRANISMSAQLSGMFTLSEAGGGATDDPGPVSFAVTCYRRNLFSISGSIQLPRGLRYIMTESLEQVPIMHLEVALAATESIEGQPTKLISVPFKSAQKNPPFNEEKVEKEPPTIPLDLMAGAEMEPEIANLPLSWTRLQFRNSTANNGRRKELQQHFTIKIQVMAHLHTGQRVPICEIGSNPMVVRGRSPRNFQNRERREAPTSGAILQKTPVAMARSSTAGSAPPTLPTSRTDSLAFSHDGGAPLFTPDILPSSSNPWDFDVPHSPDQDTATNGGTPLPEHTFGIKPGNLFASTSPEMVRPNLKRPPSAPIALDMDVHSNGHADEDAVDSIFKMSPASMAQSKGSPARKQARISLSQPSAPLLNGGLRNSSPGAFGMVAVRRPESFSLNTSSGISNEDDCSDLLYEYFPLGLDDWQEPVDAVYRPHVVHHISLPKSEEKAMGGLISSKARSRRYFSEDSM